MIIIEIIFSLILGGTFIASSIPKLCFPRGFVMNVLEYRILPFSIGYLFGWILPPLELLLACLLLSGTVVPFAAMTAAVLYISFIVAISINILRSRNLDCYCFGKKARRKISWFLVLQDGLLFGIAVLLVFLILMSEIPNVLVSWSIFRVIESRNYDSFLSFFINLGLTGIITILLRISKSGKLRFSWANR